MNDQLIKDDENVILWIQKCRFFPFFMNLINNTFILPLLKIFLNIKMRHDFSNFYEINILKILNNKKKFVRKLYNDSR